MSTLRIQMTYTFLPKTFVIFNGFSIRLKFWKAEPEGFSTIPSILYILILSIEDISISDAFSTIYVYTVDTKHESVKRFNIFKL